jgi:2-keto-3-deoxy-L-rhamnonate aldolase RhmA
MVLVQIETAESLANAGDIAALQGIDGLFVGPNDLASSLDCWPPAWDNLARALAAALARVPVVAREHGKSAGIMVPNAAVANQCTALGYDFIALTSDMALLDSAARRELAAVDVTG